MKGIDKSRRSFICTTALGVGLAGIAQGRVAVAAAADPGAAVANTKAGIRVVNDVPTGEISPARYNPRYKFDVLTPMRDGVNLAMDTICPDADGSFPVVLIRTPYNKVGNRSDPFVVDLVRRGYAVAIQDARGRFNSDGQFDPYRHEHQDGFDTVEWLAKQPWCDGNVGMIGGSYVGQTQWFAASQAPAALKAIVPTASPPGHAFMNEPLYGGSFLLAMSDWMVWMGRRSFQIPNLQGIFSEHQSFFEALPLSKLESMAGTDVSWWRQWLEHPEYDAYWEACGYEQYWARMKVPALNITGWWDMNFLGAPRNFAGMRAHGATAEAREGQRLVIGPWPHHVNTARELNGVSFGPQSIASLNAYTIRFFDRWLRGRENGLDDQARAHIFVLGANEWWEADTWPLPGTRQVPLYLHSRGHANTDRGDGTVSFDKAKEEPPDSYDSDPLNPVRTLWRLDDGPVDDRPIAARADVLCYTSAVLTEPLDVVGDIKATLYASSSARDCDWHVRLIDVHPDGAARFLCHGVLRARFREGFDKSVLLAPNEITRFEIDMTAVGVRFLAGHRIRVEIASSWFPRFDRNPQTGNRNFFTDTAQPVVARQKIYHTSKYPSHVVLPVIGSVYGASR